MPLKLYMLAGSAAVRAVLLCVKALGLEVEYEVVDLLAKEHLTLEYRKINPKHTVPVLDDDGFLICDSHAIMPYLVSKYGKDQSLYPEDLKKRTVVNERLHFDSNTLFPRGAIISRSIILHGAKEIKEVDKVNLLEAYDFVEKYLESNDWVAGNFLSVADFSFVATISTWDRLVPVDDSKYKRIKSWWKRMEQLPYYNEGNMLGLNDYQNIVNNFLKSK